MDIESMAILNLLVLSLIVIMIQMISYGLVENVTRNSQMKKPVIATNIIAEGIIWSYRNKIILSDAIVVEKQAIMRGIVLKVMIAIKNRY